MPTTWHLHGDGSLRAEAPAAGGAPRHFTYDPEDPVPTIGGNYCAVGEFPPQGEGHRADVGAPPQPGAPAAEHHDSGPSRPEGVRRVLHRARAVPAALRARRTCSSTRPSRSSTTSRSPGRGEVELWIASSAVDTDFTAKLIDVYPPNEDYPEGYDMLINDSIIRTRYREGWEREVMMEPGTPYLVRIQLPPTIERVREGPPDPDRRLLVELPAARAQPEHRRADRPAHPHDHGGADGVLRRRAPLPRRAAGHSRVRRGSSAVRSLEWRTVPGGPFVMGSDPAARLPARTTTSRRGGSSRSSRSVSRGPRSRTRSIRAFAATTGAGRASR